MPTNNTTVMTTNVEWWLILIDVLMIISTVSASLLAIVFTIMVLMYRTCRTVSMMFSSNSCLAQILFGSTMAYIAVFSFENDRQQSAYQDSLCILRGYLGYVGCGLFFYSCALQTIYRYIVIVHPTRLSWQSARVQLITISVKWLYCFLTMFPWLLTGDITYSVVDQICLVPLRLSVPIVYNMLVLYVIPMSMIITIYMKLVHHMHKISTRATSAKTLFQIRRHFIVVCRIVIIVVILLILSIPYTVFNLMSFFTKPPKYHLRIAILVLDISQPLTMVIIFVSSQPVMDIIKKWRLLPVNSIHPTVT
ncbi:unnamed protein product [Adineta ricciae]|uniref:G-protein coupled receptors family 1 profile domain-containing protein n=1 Tax=Adineta ricciae TaxID=249248 RepID=A0A816AFU0_ADIRI|nr:unnamed protein product [Adineta ricciae]CAF1597113.1 unnamed protein product [Adineta ricciae]